MISQGWVGDWACVCVCVWASECVCVCVSGARARGCVCASVCAACVCIVCARVRMCVRVRGCVCGCEWSRARDWKEVRLGGAVGPTRQAYPLGGACGLLIPRCTHSHLGPFPLTCARLSARRRVRAFMAQMCSPQQQREHPIEAARTKRVPHAAMGRRVWGCLDGLDDAAAGGTRGVRMGIPWGYSGARGWGCLDGLDDARGSH
jgi:hypothetical protein